MSGVRTIILPVIVYECETWSLTLREERRLGAFDNRVMRRFELNRDELTWEWRKLHNEELNDLCFSPNIVRVIKPRIMRWAGHVARMGDRRGVYSVVVGKLRERSHLENPVVDEMIILIWILWTWDVGLWTGSSWLRIGTFGGHLWMR